MKNAEGDLNALRREIETAKTDYRDVLVGAEYPLAFQQPALTNLALVQSEQIYGADWRQYAEWFNR